MGSVFDGLPSEEMGRDSDSEKFLKNYRIRIVLGLVATGFYYLGSLGFGGVKFGEKPKVAVVKVDGVIENFQTARTVSKISEDETIKAAVMKVNSPEGYVSPYFQLESAISNLAEEKPTVGAVGQLELPGLSGSFCGRQPLRSPQFHSGFDRRNRRLGVLQKLFGKQEDRTLRL